MHVPVWRSRLGLQIVEHCMPEATDARSRRCTPVEVASQLTSLADAHARVEAEVALRTCVDPNAVERLCRCQTTLTSSSA